MATKTSAKSDLTTVPQAAATASWLPMIIILMAQIQMAFNVNALPVSIGPISEDLNTPATTIGTALVVYSLCVAAFVMVGAKIGKLFGERLVFQVTVILHGLAMGLMAFSPTENVMFYAQALAGLAAAALVPSLVVLIAANYHGRQQEQALGLLAGAPAASGVMAFIVAGWLGTALSWRYSFGILVVLSIAVLVLSFRLTPVKRQPGIKIDLTGAVLAALSISLISFGFNNLNNWGLVMAKANAPFTILGLVAGALHDCDRCGARPGVLLLGALSSGKGQDAAAGAGSAGLKDGTQRHLCPAGHGRAGTGGQLPDPALYPDRAGPHLLTDLDCRRPLHAGDLRLGGADRAPVQALLAAPDRQRSPLSSSASG